MGFGDKVHTATWLLDLVITSRLFPRDMNWETYYWYIHALEQRRQWVKKNNQPVIITAP